MQKTITFYIQNQDSVTPKDVILSNDGLVTINSLTPHKIAQSEQEFLDAVAVYESSEANRTLRGDLFEPQSIDANNK